MPSQEPKLRTFTVTLDADEFVVLETVLEQALSGSYITLHGRTVVQQLLLKVRKTKPNPRGAKS